MAGNLYTSESDSCQSSSKFILVDDALVVNAICNDGIEAAEFTTSNFKLNKFIIFVHIIDSSVDPYCWWHVSAEEWTIWSDGYDRTRTKLVRCSGQHMISDNLLWIGQFIFIYHWTWDTCCSPYTNGLPLEFIPAHHSCCLNSPSHPSRGNSGRAALW